MLGAAAVVIKNKFLNEQKTARNERLCGLPHNIGGLVKARAVQDLGEPRHVESAGKVFGGEIPAYEGYPVGHAGVGDDAFRKGAGGGKIKDCGAQAGIVAAEMDGVGSGRAPEIKQMGTARKVNVRDAAFRLRVGDVVHPHEETFPLARIFGIDGRTVAGRPVLADGLVQLGPAGHKMAVMFHYMPKITGIAPAQVIPREGRQFAGFALTDQQAHCTQGG